MKRTVEQAIKDALEAMGAGVPGSIEVQVPKDETHGDLASPVAMGLAKELKKSPRAIAAASRARGWCQTYRDTNGDTMSEFAIR